MKFEDFKVLDSDEDDRWEHLTTHPLITYDSSVETYWVNLGKGSSCEVYGFNRAKRAFDIAETCFLEGEPFSEQ
jgi:hypothetical protein